MTTKTTIAAAVITALGLLAPIVWRTTVGQTVPEGFVMPNPAEFCRANAQTDDLDLRRYWQRVCL